MNQGREAAARWQSQAKIGLSVRSRVASLVEVPDIKFTVRTIAQPKIQGANCSTHPHWAAQDLKIREF